MLLTHKLIVNAKLNHPKENTPRAGRQITVDFMKSTINPQCLSVCHALLLEITDN